MRLYPLDKAVLKLRPQPIPFLNGLTSNEMDAAHNAFVNLHGRIIATFDQLKINDEEFLIVLEKPFLSAVLEHLDRYRRLAGVTIETVEAQVYFDLDADTSLNTDDYVLAQKKGRLIVTKRVLSPNIREEEFTLFRLANNIPLQGKDYTDEFLLNINETDFVSFTKGCFLGEEPISKVHNRSKPTWLLMVKDQDQCSDEEKQKMTSKAMDPKSQRTLGFVFVKNE